MGEQDAAAAEPYVGMELASGEFFPVSGSYVCVRHVDESEDAGCDMYPVDRHGAMYLKGWRVPLQSPCMHRAYWRLKVIYDHL
ncbi:MAG: hypothetical protein MPJ05_08505 [Nitrosopumilus sp.]|nr:hypothetical protein [Nitrosopumilus sp.]